ncbi:MAG: hypothetical protein H0U75_09990 [Legionella sp.]|nr:hypothetical protein [Legionella sp.]
MITSVGKATLFGASVVIPSGIYVGSVLRGVLAAPVDAAVFIPSGVIALQCLPALLVGAVAIMIGVKLCKQIKSPFILIGAQFLLAASCCVLSKFLSAAIICAFVPLAINPFTLPFIIAAGAK